MPNIIIMSKKITISCDNVTIKEQTKFINNDDDTKSNSSKRRRIDEQTKSESSKHSQTECKFTCYSCGKDLSTEFLYLDRMCQNCSNFWCAEKCADMIERCTNCGAKIQSQ